MPIASTGLADAVVCSYYPNGSPITPGQLLPGYGVGPLALDIEALNAAPVGFHPVGAPDVTITFGYVRTGPITVEVADGQHGYVVTPNGTWIPSRRLLRLLSTLHPTSPVGTG